MVLLHAVVGLLLVAGLAGAVLPGLPGALLVFVAALIYAVATGFDPIGGGRLLLLAALTAVSYVLDYLAAALGARRFGGSRAGIIGAVVGGLVGLLLLGPFGLLLGPFLGALAGELLSGRRLTDSARGGFGAFLGVLVGAIAKLGLTVLMIGLFLWWIWRG